jgi:hypothetical protein
MATIKVLKKELGSSSEHGQRHVAVVGGIQKETIVCAVAAPPNVGHAYHACHTRHADGLVRGISRGRE